MKISPRTLLPAILLVNPLFVMGEGAPPPLVINEIHYDEDNKTVRAEFIEIYNPTDQPVSLDGWELTGGIRYVFPQNTNIGDGAYLVIAEDPVTISTRLQHQGALGPWTGKLRNSGETVNLRDPSGEAISKVDYKLGLPPNRDG